jgi:hypothetical protein
MLPFVGQRFTVASRALKVCCAIGNARLDSVVFLDQLRCDGTGHAGCQADCRLFWREEWLRPAVGETDRPSSAEDDMAKLVELVRSNVRQDGVDGADPRVFRCQATEIPRAGTAVDWRQPAQYVREVSSGNVGFAQMLRVMTRALLRELGKRLRLFGELPLQVAGESRIDGKPLDLKPGEWVEVRSAEEIGRTLDADRRHRGLTFTYEMAQHCGERFRVKRRLDRLIDERNGRMLEMKNDCIELDDLVCTGNRATYLWFCRRDLHPYWREAWLRRVAPEPPR